MSTDSSPDRYTMRHPQEHKDATNAELINVLDRDYRILKCYPQSDDPTLLEFWSDRDPRHKIGFQVLLYKHGKICRVSRDTNNDYFIEIADRNDDDEKRRW